jgi:hypothetical protein
MRDAELLRSRVVDDPVAVLDRALDEALTGHARIEPQDAFLFGDDVAARVVFEGGVPVAVAEPSGERAGPAAVETLVGPGPYAVEVYRRTAGDEGAGDAEWEAASVPADLPARRLGADDLAARTREAAPGDAAALDDPVAAFLDDAAVADAREWGLTDHLAEGSPDDAPPSPAEDGQR